MTSPRWRLLPPAPPSAVERLSASLKVHPRLAAVLWARGLREDAADQLDPPFVLSDIPHLHPAAERLVEAVERGHRIRIHGDYDADGISGTAVLQLGLSALGAQVEAFLPHRLREGYGVHPDRVEEHAAACDLFLTVDCGISNLSEIERLQSAGVEVIVSDHHAPGQRLPDCLVVHPATSPQARPGRAELTGAGVAYHLLWAVHQRMGVAMEETERHLDLATIGTVADVAVLLGENRALVKRGLQRMADSEWAGMRAMRKLSRLQSAPTARDVAFLLAPRFNAAGRLGEAELGLELMTTASERRALELATLLDQFNRQRGEIQAAMLESALGKVDPSAPAIVVEDPAWHKGVMGIVASHLLERFHKPVFIAAQGAGSVRSVPGISAVGALAAASEHLGRWGGHAAAAGFGLDMARFPDFRSAIYDYVEAQPPAAPSVVVDALLGLDEADLDLFRAQAQLEPYGQGHLAPRFLLHGRLQQARAVGSGGAHLQLHLSDGDRVRKKGVAFKKGDLLERLPPGGDVDAAVQLALNDFNGSKNVEFQADGLRPGERLGLGDETGEVAPGRLRLRRTKAATALRVDPGADDPLADLREALRNAEDVLDLHLSDDDLAALEAEADAWPTVTDMRTAWVARAQLKPLRYAEPLAGRVEAVLQELGAYDERGRVKLGRKVEPYDSPTLRAGLVRRYLLRTLAQAYLRLDDAGFSAAVVRLAELHEEDAA